MTAPSHSPTRRAICAGVALAALAPAAPALAAEARVYSDWRGRAIRGYDPVAYFTEKRPVPGKSDITFEWNGAQWRFANEESREAFRADPAAYAPQYGGWCAWAMAQGATASVDPEAWDIIDGKLYLNYSLDVQSRWRKDIPAFVSKADVLYPSVVD
jgi:YHS domain-containing protein